MSYYSNPFKYVLTNHALRRAKERLNMKELSSYEIQNLIEEYLEYSTFNGYKDGNCIVLKNFQFNITFIVDESKKIIKTIY